MQQELEDIVKKENRHLIKNFDENVQLIKLAENNFVLKKIVIPFKNKEMKSQHNFISYLDSNKINVAKVYGFTIHHNKIIELQEYIENHKSIKVTDLIIAISKFHNISVKYRNSFVKRRKFKCKTICRNTELKYLLLDFRYKYYKYPINCYKKNKGLIDKKNKEQLEEIVNIYTIFYKEFIKDYNIKSCVIHNDITSNNVINNNGNIFFIDFDLAIKSCEYVDFIDAIIKRHSTLKEIYNDFENIKKETIESISLYNKYNDNIKLKYIGVMKMLVLKLMAVNLYLRFNNDNINEFKKDFFYLYKIIKLCESEVNYEKCNYQRSLS